MLRKILNIAQTLESFLHDPQIKLTNVDVSAECSLGQLSWLVGQGDLYDAGHLPRRGRDADGVASDQLAPDGRRPEVNLEQSSIIAINILYKLNLQQLPLQRSLKKT